MKINTVSAHHHIILGTTQINLFGDSEKIKKSYFNKHKSDLVIDVTTENDINYYTYIIGENGAGKTLLFKTIIDFINNTNKEEHDASLERILNLYTDNKFYRQIKHMDDTRHELHGSGIYARKFSPDQTENQEDFLEYYDAQLIYISSAFDRSIVHRNDRFRSFNYLSGINQTKFLFFSALRRFERGEAIDVLNTLVGRDQVAWKAASRLRFKTVESYQGGRFVELRNINGMNIYSFLALMDKLEVDENGVLDESGLSDNERRLFSTIYHSGPFFKFLHNSKMTAADTLRFMRSATTTNRIRKFLAKKSGKEGDLTIRIRNGESPDFQKRRPSLFRDNEILLLSLLEHLGLVETEITANKVSIERFSSGEQSLVRLFSFFADLPLPEKQERLIVFFDEPENSLHPKWQHQFPFYFKKIVEEVYGIKNSHFIIATHSPLIVMRTSGEPGMNVLRFYKDEKKQFASEAITDIKKFSIEEILLDEFLVSYREKSREDEVLAMLNERNENQEDPINSITRSFELRKKIDDLYNSLRDKL